MCFWGFLCPVKNGTLDLRGFTLNYILKGFLGDLHLITYVTLDLDSDMQNYV